MRPALPILLLAAVSLAACGTKGGSPSAAESASRLLDAAMKGDRVAFEAQIDRPAVRDDVRRQVAQMASVTNLDVEGGASEFALDRMITPSALKLVKAGTGEALTAAPTLSQVAPLMRPLDRKHACLSDATQPSTCLLTFAKTKDQWRLVGMKAIDLRIELAGD